MKTLQSSAESWEGKWKEIQPQQEVEDGFLGRHVYQAGRRKPEQRPWGLRAGEAGLGMEWARGNTGRGCDKGLSVQEGATGGT